VPLFEFECVACRSQFETLVRPASEEVACPQCGGRDLRKLFSLFAVDSAATRSVALKSGRRHAATEQRDKAMAEREHELHHQH
jgi:putative FmdB family regulatory protein